MQSEVTAYFTEALRGLSERLFEVSSTVLNAQHQDVRGACNQISAVLHRKGCHESRCAAHRGVAARLLRAAHQPRTIAFSSVKADSLKRLLSSRHLGCDYCMLASDMSVHSERNRSLPRTITTFITCAIARMLFAAIFVVRSWLHWRSSSQRLSASSQQTGVDLTDKIAVLQEVWRPAA